MMRKSMTLIEAILTGRHVAATRRVTYLNNRMEMQPTISAIGGQSDHESSR